MKTCSQVVHIILNRDKELGELWEELCDLKWHIQQSQKEPFSEIYPTINELMSHIVREINLGG